VAVRCYRGDSSAVTKPSSAGVSRANKTIFAMLIGCCDSRVSPELIFQGKLGLHGAYFGISTGTLLALDETSGRFEPVAAVRAHRAAVARPDS
jgi:carbonic anhydrase